MRTQTSTERQRRDYDLLHACPDCGNEYITAEALAWHDCEADSTHACPEPCCDCGTATCEACTNPECEHECHHVGCYHERAQS